MPPLFLSAGLAFLLTGQASGQWLSTPFNPPALPLAVRTPYLNTWLAQGSGPHELSDFYPQFRDLSLIEWYAAVKVDGQTCRIMGVGGDGIVQANQTALDFTPTRTSFLLRCFTVDVNATFMTPIVPTDLVRQSMPFSYFYMQATANDGNNHNISLYSDIAGNLLSGSSTQLLDGSPPNTADDSIILSMTLHSPQPFSESGVSGNALDATAYYGLKTDTLLSPNIYSWQISTDTSARGNFANTSALSNTTATTSLADFDSVNNPVLAIAVDYGSLVATGNTVWAVGVARDPVVRYASSSDGVQLRHPYYMSAYPSAINAMQFFLDDFGVEAFPGAIEFDTRLQSDAGKISLEYADLLALVARQALSAMDITLVQNSDGSWDTSDIKAFVDNTGNVGSTTGVNVVDALYASLPAYLYLNPELVGYLLNPLLEYQDSGQYQLTYAARSIGSAYPNATADSINQPHQFGVEETANMIVLTLAHAQRSGNGTLISKHYSLLRNWADYLVENSLSPVNQSSPDFIVDVTSTGIPTNNLTNIALKGIIGIAAMGKISAYAGVKTDASNFTNIAQQYIQQWAELTISTDKSHLLMVYDGQQSEALMYNLYADKLLQLNLVPETVYDIQSTFIASRLSSDLLGIPLDNNNISIGTIDNSPVWVLFSRTDWMLFSAAVATNTTTQNAIIQLVHNLASANRSSSPFCVELEVQTGICAGGSTSPAQGGLFALLGMNQPIKSSVSLPTDGSTIPSLTSQKKSHAGEIAGGVIGGLAILAIIAVAERYLRRRHQRKRNLNYYNLEDLKGGRSPGLVNDKTQQEVKT